MDVRELNFDDESFDVAIDKGKLVLNSPIFFLKASHLGTMDAMMTAKGDVWVGI